MKEKSIERNRRKPLLILVQTGKKKEIGVYDDLFLFFTLDIILYQLVIESHRNISQL